MKTLWPKYKVPIILASIGALFHLIFVVYPLVASGYSGEGIAMWLLIVDFPLWWLENAARKFWGVLGLSKTMHILYYSIFGTLMYILAGWVVGWLWDHFLFRKVPKA